MDSSSPLTRPLEPEGLPRALADWLAEPDPAHPLPLPGDAWSRRLLVVLADHVERQRWVARVLRDHLGADLAQLGNLGGFGHPEDLLQRGPVPGLPGWTYFFHPTSPRAPGSSPLAVASTLPDPGVHEASFSFGPGGVLLVAGGVRLR